MAARVAIDPHANAIKKYSQPLKSFRSFAKTSAVMPAVSLRTDLRAGASQEES